MCYANLIWFNTYAPVCTTGILVSNQNVIFFVPNHRCCRNVVFLSGKSVHDFHLRSNPKLYRFPLVYAFFSASHSLSGISTERIRGHGSRVLFDFIRATHRRISRAQIFHLQLLSARHLNKHHTSIISTVNFQPYFSIV